MSEKNNTNNKPLLEEMVTIPKKEYEALKLKHDERDSYYDKYVRAHAEFENAKKRMEKDGWIFCHNGGMLMGFRSIKPCSWAAKPWSGNDML